jgi:hypothetical protein
LIGSIFLNIVKYVCLFNSVVAMAALGGRERRDILCNSRHSRFGEFNSRLGRQKFPVRSATEIRSQELDLVCRFRVRAAILSRESTKIPLQREKARIRPR